MNEQILNIKLVGEVEKHPELYNYQLPAYSRRDITEKAWSEVGKAVNLSGTYIFDKYLLFLSITVLCTNIKKTSTEFLNFAKYI